MKTLQTFVFLLLMGCVAGADAALPEGSLQGSLHSFADLYRASVGAEYAVSGAKLQGIPVSFSLTPTPAAPAPSAQHGIYVFSSGALPRPAPWLLLLSGLALAGWVARRRLGYTL